MDFEEYFNKLQETSSAQQAWSEKQADKQMGFQWAMSSSAHQREMEDLQKAGLNPVLAANAGAATGAGAMAQADSGLTSAMAGLMSKMIDVDMMNAAAAMSSGGSGGYGGSGSSGALEDSIFDAGIEFVLNQLGINTRSKTGQALVQNLSSGTQDLKNKYAKPVADYVSSKYNNAKAAVNGLFQKLKGGSTTHPSKKSGTTHGGSGGKF